MKKIIVAESAGFCFGVSRSVELAEALLAEKGNACSLGPLIHNEDVVAELCRRGLRVADSPEEIQAGEAVMIRAHGAAPSVYEELEKRGALVTDATCPKVKMIHRIVRKAAEEGRFVIVIGDNEVESGNVTVKDMAGGEPFATTLTEAADAIAARL